MAKNTKRSGGSPKPKNPALYSRVKAEAKKKKESRSHVEQSITTSLTNTEP